MKNIKQHFALALISMSTIVFIACNSNSNKSNNTQYKGSDGSSSQLKKKRKLPEHIQVPTTLAWSRQLFFVVVVA